MKKLLVFLAMTAAGFCAIDGNAADTTNSIATPPLDENVIEAVFATAKKRPVLTAPVPPVADAVPPVKKTISFMNTPLKLTLASGPMEKQTARGFEGDRPQTVILPTHERHGVLQIDTLGIIIRKLPVAPPDIPKHEAAAEEVSANRELPAPQRQADLAFWGRDETVFRNGAMLRLGAVTEPDPRHEVPAGWGFKLTLPVGDRKK
jgi:hypothetical protein